MRILPWRILMPMRQLCVGYHGILPLGARRMSVSSSSMSNRFRKITAWKSTFEFVFVIVVLTYCTQKIKYFHRCFPATSSKMCEEVNEIHIVIHTVFPASRVPHARTQCASARRCAPFTRQTNINHQLKIFEPVRRRGGCSSPSRIGCTLTQRSVVLRGGCACSLEGTTPARFDPGGLRGSIQVVCAVGGC